MLELADIVGRHGPILSRYQDRMLPSHRRALAGCCSHRPVGRPCLLLLALPKAPVSISLLPKPPLP